MPEYDLVVTGRLVTPAGTVDDGWVAVSGGKIAAIGNGPPPPAASHYDAGGAWVIPGAIDGQTHAGSYAGLPGLESTTRSAVAGGVTTIVDMPYDSPTPLTDLAHLEAKIAAIETLAYCDVALYATVAKGQGVDAVSDLIRNGIAAFKVSSFESNAVRFPRIPNDEILDLLEAVAATDIPVGLHNEDQEIVLARTARLRAAGRNTIEWHSPARPPVAEDVATVAFLELGAASGAHVHIVHISEPRGFELVERYRREGVRATAELCIHYGVFDPALDGARLGARLKVNPPMRPNGPAGIWAAFDKGQIDFVSSDHSSWPVDNKLTASVFDAGAGIPGLETLVPAFYTELAARRARPIADLVLYMCERPAKFFGLWPRKGALTVGADADIVFLETGSWTYDASAAHDDLKWSPFDGRTMQARAAKTFVRGALVWDGASIAGAPGSGRYVRRQS
jgi:allantoinase